MGSGILGVRRIRLLLGARYLGRSSRESGYLWTPGYWGYSGNAYGWNQGYWATQVGFYGGINYGAGYYGSGYSGCSLVGQ